MNLSVLTKFCKWSEFIRKSAALMVIVIDALWLLICDTLEKHFLTC